MFSSPENECEPAFRKIEKIPLSEVLTAKGRGFKGFRICLIPSVDEIHKNIMQSQKFFQGGKISSPRPFVRGSGGG
jgi:hypothetical protein